MTWLRAMTPATKNDLDQVKKAILMALDTDLKAAVDKILAKNDAIIELVGNLRDAINNSNTVLPAAVQEAVARLTAEADKDDSVLSLPTPTP